MKVINHHKEWWGQAEALNTFLLMSKLLPEEREKYYRKFEKQWEYINRYLLDPQFKGWFPSGIDEKPKPRTSPKAQIWKGNYHTTRALVSCLNNLP